MKGKSLYLLIEELNKAERHQLLNACKKTGDKRHSSLYNLLKKTTGSHGDFEEALSASTVNLTKEKKDEKEKDKILRRFIDFAVKEIEQIKLRNFLNEEPLYRNFLLSMIYKGRGDELIFSRYLERTGELSTGKNPMINDFYLNSKVELTARIHNKKELRLLRELLVEKNRIIQKNYHSDLSRIYELLSFLKLEDQELVKEVKELILTDSEAETLISLSSGTVEEVRYLNAGARFCFFDEKKFSRLIKQSEKAAQKLSVPEERAKKEREIALLNSLHQFHIGKDIETIFNVAAALEDEKDSVMHFYYHLFKILRLARQEKERLPGIRELRKLKTEPENEFRKEFLIALTAFLSGDYSTALKLINQLSYVSNFEISSWSRLIELRIHIRKNNFSLCESLEGRITRYFQTNPGKLFTTDSNRTALKLLLEEMKGKKKPKSIPGLTVLHQSILEG